MSEQRIEFGDCADVLAAMPADSVSAVVSDPPYGMGKEPDPAAILTAWLAGDRANVSGGGFMGKAWDAFVPGPHIWRECFRVLKPGGHLIAFASTRTQDWMALALRLAGFEIRDCGAWLYWSGFPKSLDVSKAIDRSAGAAREVVGSKLGLPGYHLNPHDGANIYGSGIGQATAGQRLRASQITAPATPATPAAHRWSGWGTALKPAHEPFIIARKPLSGTVAATVLEHGTGALNIDGCRMAYGDPAWPGPNDAATAEAKHASVEGLDSRRASTVYSDHDAPRTNGFSPAGRWPGNVYYCPKASTAEREAGLGDLPTGQRDETRDPDAPGANNPRNRGGSQRANVHPTVKPLKLMRWLVRLVTPPGGLVVDPFVGSGTTAIAAALEGVDCVGIEMSPEYAAIARARLAHWQRCGSRERALYTPPPEDPRQFGLFG